MSEFAHDLRHAVRLLRRNPGFTVIVILTLALGIGADTAIFSVVKATLLDPLPYAEPHLLVHIGLHDPERPENTFEVSYPDFSDWRERAESFTGLAAVPTSLGRVFLSRGASLQPVRGVAVSGNLFRVLGVAPALGRALLLDDDVPGAAPVAVIGHGLWRHAFGGDAEVIGTTVELDGEEHTLVGVMPAGFEYPPRAEVWTALAPATGSFAENRSVGFLQLVGRLDAGVSAEAARQELDALIETVSKPEWPAGVDADVAIAPLREYLLGDLRTPLIVLLGAAGLVLLIACVNVANLLVARGVARGRELAIRAALGAGGSRLLRQMLTENLVLALAGGGLGLALAAAGTGLLSRLRGDELFRVGQADIDGGVLLFALAVSVLTALLFGLAPAWQGWRRSLVAALRRREGGGAEGAPARRLRGGLVVAEIALALVLLIGASLLIRSLLELQHAETGFQREGLLTAELFFPGSIYTDPPAWREFYAGLVDDLERIPGVEAASAVLIRPLEGPAGFDYPFTVEGQTEFEQAANPLLNYQAVTPEYFRTVGLPLLAGRAFRDADREDAPGVVIVSRGLAERYWPGKDPVGKRLKWGGPDSPAPWLTVVGVAGDARYRGMASARLDVYVPFTQTPWRLNHLVVRAAGEPTAAVPEIGRVLARRDDRIEAVSVATVRQLVHRSLRTPRSNTILLGLFAALALLLGGIGIYGVLAGAVNQRRRELGVRMAMGASPRQVMRLIVGYALRLAAVGLLVGLPVAALLTRTLRDLLYEVGVLDPLTFVAVPAFVLGVAAVASLVPAARAAGVDPATVMRVE